MYSLCSDIGAEACVDRSRLLSEHCASANARASSDSSYKNVEQPNEVSSFEGNMAFIIGYINLDLTIGLRRGATHFHVINTRTLYHLLLGRLGSTGTRMCPPYIICALNSSRNARKFMSMPLDVHSREMKLLMGSLR